MNTYKIKFADGFAILLLLISYIVPSFANQIKVNTNVMIMLINCYIIAYLAYTISFTDTKKVILMGLPLIIYSIFIIFYKKGLDVKFNKYLLTDIEYIIVCCFSFLFSRNYIIHGFWDKYNKYYRVFVSFTLPCYT